MAKPLDHAIIGIALTVTQFEVIHMEAYRNLQPVNNLVGNARIIQVYLKTYACGTLGELSIVKKKYPPLSHIGRYDNVEATA